MSRGHFFSATFFAMVTGVDVNARWWGWGIFFSLLCVLVALDGVAERVREAEPETEQTNG